MRLEAGGIVLVDWRDALPLEATSEVALPWSWRIAASFTRTTRT